MPYCYLSAEQYPAIKMFSSERLALELMKAGFDEEEIMSLDRPNLMEMWAMCVLEGKEKPPAAIVTVGEVVADPELEKMRLQMEMITIQMERETAEREERLHREVERRPVEEQQRHFELRKPSH